MYFRTGPTREANNVRGKSFPRFRGNNNTRVVVVFRRAVRRRKKRFVFRPLCRDEYLSRDRRPGETAGSGWRGGPLLIFSFLFLCFCVFFVYCRHEVTEEI